VDKSRGRYGLYCKPYVNFIVANQFEYVYKVGNSFLTPEIPLPLFGEMCKLGVFLLLVLVCPMSRHLILFINVCKSWFYLLFYWLSWGSLIQFRDVWVLLQNQLLNQVVLL
jgi:hypothetical protein